MIAYTSGSTGVPKGCVHHHADILGSADSYARYVLRPSEEDRFGGHPTLAFTFGTGGLLVFPFRFGAATVLSGPFDPERMLEVFERERVTVAFCASTSYRLMLRVPDVAGRFDLGSLRLCVSAAEPLPAATYEAWVAADRQGVPRRDRLDRDVPHLRVVGARPGPPGRDRRAGARLRLPRRRRGGPRGAARHARADRHQGPDRLQVLAEAGAPGRVRAVRRLERDRRRLRPRRRRLLLVPVPVRRHDRDGRLQDPGARGRARAGRAPRGRRVARWWRPRTRRAASCRRRSWSCAPGFTATDELAKELQDHVKKVLAPYKYPRQVAFVPVLPHTETGKIRRVELRQQEAGRAASPVTAPFPERRAPVPALTRQALQAAGPRPGKEA